MPGAASPDWPYTTNQVPRRPWVRKSRLAYSAGGGDHPAPHEKGPTLPPLTLKESGQVELRKLGVPLPSEFMVDLSPIAALLFLQDTAEGALRCLTDAVARDNEDGAEVQPVVSEVLNGMTAALAGTIHALVALEVLPPEAEAAMTDAARLPNG